MKKGSYVIITNPSCNLYRRRCKLVNQVEGEDKWIAYSEGLEEEEVVSASDFEVSRF